MEMNTSTLAVLRELYPGAFLLDVRQVAAIMGLSEKTVRNLGGRFLVPSIKIGDSRRYRIDDVATVIDAAAGRSSASALVSAPAREQRGRGRPRKAGRGA